MIIKLIPVKNKSGAVGRVVNYIAQDKGRIADYKEQGIFQNLIKTELPAIEESFEQNYSDFAIQRSDGNIGMHVILSLSPLDRDKATPEMMDDLAQTYLDKAFPDALAFGAHHKEQDHWHSHLFVSANKMMSREGTRLSKQDLKDIHQHMLDYIQDKYPQLEHSKIDMSKWGQKLHSEKAYWAERRNPDLELDKDQLAEQVQQLFRASANSTDFYKQLDKVGYQTYEYQGETKGVFWKDGDIVKKMRFSRLGIKDEMRQALDVQEQRLNELEQLRNPEREQGQQLEQMEHEEPVSEEIVEDEPDVQMDEQETQNMSAENDMNESLNQRDEIQEMDMER